METERPDAEFPDLGGESLGLDDLKRIALESLAQGRRTLLEPPEPEAAKPEAAHTPPPDAETALQRIVAEVDGIDTDIDGLQDQLNRLAVRKAVLQRQVESLLADIAEEFDLVAHFDRHNGVRERAREA